MVEPLADQMVDLSRKVSKFISQLPREKISRRFSRIVQGSCAAFLPTPLLPRTPCPSADPPQAEKAQPHRKQRREATPLSSTLIIRIFGEKSSNIVQKIQQPRRS
jgi:hypothetical protein